MHTPHPRYQKDLSLATYVPTAFSRPQPASLETSRAALCPLSPTVKEEITPSGSPLFNLGDAAIKTEEQWQDSSQLESRPDFELWKAPAYEPSGPSMKKGEEEVEPPASPLYDSTDDEEIKVKGNP